MMSIPKKNETVQARDHRKRRGDQERAERRAGNVRQQSEVARAKAASGDTAERDRAGHDKELRQLNIHNVGENQRSGREEPAENPAARQSQPVHHQRRRDAGNEEDRKIARAGDRTSRQSRRRARMPDDERHERHCLDQDDEPDALRDRDLLHVGLEALGRRDHEGERARQRGEERIVLRPAAAPVQPPVGAEDERDERHGEDRKARRPGLHLVDRVVGDAGARNRCRARGTPARSRGAGNRCSPRRARRAPRRAARRRPRRREGREGAPQNRRRR